MEANEVFEKVKGLFVEDLGIDESKVCLLYTSDAADEP